MSKHPNKKNIIRKISQTLKQKFQSMSPEERQAIRDKFTGPNNPNFGKKWNKKQKKAASIRVKQNPLSTTLLQAGNKKAWENTEYRQRISLSRQGEGNSFYGKKHSKTTKKKISQKQKERFNSKTPEQRYKTNSQIRKVEINETIYFGVSEAARVLQVSPATICHRIKSPNPKFHQYKYA